MAHVCIAAHLSGGLSKLSSRKDNRKSVVEKPLKSGDVDLALLIHNNSVMGKSMRSAWEKWMEAGGPPSHSWLWSFCLWRKCRWEGEGCLGPDPGGGCAAAIDWLDESSHRPPHTAPGLSPKPSLWETVSALRIAHLLVLSDPQGHTLEISTPELEVWGGSITPSLPTFPVSSLRIKLQSCARDW